MLTHRTEYQISVNGSGWGAYVNSVWTANAFTVLANEEECGSYARSIGPLTTGSYNIRLRVTSLPETALSTILYTETGAFSVNNTTYVTTSQPVQSSIANGSLKLTAAGVEYQIIQTNVAAASLSITGAAVTSQPTQNIYANGPLPLVGTVITDNKVQTESITGVVVIYGTVDQSQKTQTEVVDGTVATVTPSVSITSGTALQVVLDWSDYAANTTFDVYRHTSTFTPPGTGTKVGNALTVSTFTELTTAATYYYRVIAVSASGSSVPSNQISVTTAASGGPAAFRALSTAQLGNNSLALNYPSGTFAGDLLVAMLGYPDGNIPTDSHSITWTQMLNPGGGATALWWAIAQHTTGTVSFTSYDDGSGEDPQVVSGIVAAFSSVNTSSPIDWVVTAQKNIPETTSHTCDTHAQAATSLYAAFVGVAPAKTLTPGGSFNGVAPAGSAGFHLCYKESAGTSPTAGTASWTLAASGFSIAFGIKGT